MVIATIAALVLLPCMVYASGTSEAGGAAAAKPAATRSVTLLTWSHFIPTYNEELKAEVQAWGTAKGIDARVDFLSLPDLTTRLTAEVESQQGHDAVVVWNFSPALYKDNLVNLDDVASSLEKKYGPWSEGARYVGLLDGHWKAIPWSNQSLIADINDKYWATIGMTPDQVANLTWDQFLDAAKKLKEIGHPVGFALNNTFDANGGLYPIIWSFGARVVDENGKIAVDSPQMRQAMEYVKTLSQYFAPEVYAWDDAGNNKFLLSGLGSWTPNPPSIRPAAVRDSLPVAPDLDHVTMPGGPSGRYRVADFINVGVWKFSKNIDQAKELIAFLMDEKNTQKQIASSVGYNVPSLTGYTAANGWWKDHPDLKLAYYSPPAEQLRPSGWPAPPGKEIQIAYNLNIIPVMFAKYAKGESSLDEAIAWGKQQLEQVYAK